MTYKWKRIEGSRDGLNNGFSGKHVERMLKHKGGKFIIFGKAARANAPRALMIKNIKKENSQRKKFEVYGSKARGLSRANHALSISVDLRGCKFARHDLNLISNEVAKFRLV